MNIPTLTIYKNNSINIDQKIINFFNRKHIQDAFFLHLHFRIFYKKFFQFYSFEKEETWILLKTDVVTLYLLYDTGPYNKEISSQFYLFIPYHDIPVWYIPLNWVTLNITYMDNVLNKTYATNFQLYSVFSIRQQLLTRIKELPDNDPYAGPILKDTLTNVPSSTLININNQFSGVLKSNIGQGIIIEATYPPGPLFSGSQRIPYQNGQLELRFNNSIQTDVPNLAEFPLQIPFVEYDIQRFAQLFTGTYSGVINLLEAFTIEYPIIGNSIKVPNFQYNPIFLVEPNQDNIFVDQIFNGTTLINQPGFVCIYDSTSLLNPVTNTVDVFTNFGTTPLNNPDIKWTAMWHNGKTGTKLWSNAIVAGKVGYERYYNFVKQLVPNYKILPNDIQTIAVFNSNQTYNYPSLDYKQSQQILDVTKNLNNNVQYYGIIRNFISDASNWICILGTFGDALIQQNPYSPNFWNNFISTPNNRFKYVTTNKNPAYYINLNPLVEGIRSAYMPDKFLTNVRIVMEKTITFKNVQITTDSNGEFLFEPIVTNLQQNTLDYNLVGIKSIYLNNQILDLNNQPAILDPFFNWSISSPIAKYSISYQNSDFKGPILSINNTYESRVIFNQVSSLANEKFKFFIKTNYKNIKFQIQMIIIFK